MERKKTFNFHVYLPENIEKIGQPVVLGDADELGAWGRPIVKLRQQNRTYWKSDPVSISIISSIQYKYAIHIPKSDPTSRRENFEFEGFNEIDAGDNRTLDVQRNDQFDIWKIRDDFSFIDYIYNSIEINNLRDKVLDYQHLLTLHSDLTIHASNPKFIIDRIDDNITEKRLFLCILLGYYISKREGLSYELPDNFPSNLLLNALENYKQESLPLDAKDQMYTAILALIQHNAFQMKFEWLIIFSIATKVDPNYTFINHLKGLKYSNENLEKFIERCKIIKTYTENIKLEFYVEIAKWLIQLCHNIDSLLKMWNDVLVHNNEIDYSLFECFIGQIRSRGDAVALEYYFRSLSKDYRDRVSGIVRNQVISLLESPNKKWTYENIDAIKKLLHDNSLDWHRDEVIQSLELISQSHTLELLNIFPDILVDWFRSDFSDTKEKKIPKICVMWFKNFLSKLNTSTSNKNESNFIFSVFQQLDLMYPLLGQKINIWRDLTAIAMDRVKNCSEDRILAATKLIIKIKQDDVKVLFFEMVKDILNKSTLQTHDQLLNKIRIICDCRTTKALEVSNMMSEDILYHIMNRLQSQSIASSASGLYLNILKASKFWNIILRATGSVTKLNSNPFVKNTKTSINELAGLFREKTIDIQLLQQILEYDDEYLFRHFDAAVAKKKALGDVIVSRDEIAKLREICNHYQIQLDVLSKFYIRFCPNDKVPDVADFIRDVKQHLQNLDKTKLSSAEEFLSFLKKIPEYDIKNLINGVDDHSDERLTQEDTVSSLIQVRQLLFPLMNKNMDSISGLLKELLNVIKKNHTLREKIALCNSINMVLRNMYNNIQNRGEVTKEKIKNAVFNGTFTFTRDQKEDKCLVSLQYPSKSNVKYNLNEILDLRGRALLIAKLKNSVTINNKEEEISKDVMDKFIDQVDIAQEIINIVSMLIQMGHFGYRKFENKLQGTDNMKAYLEFLKEELKEWETGMHHHILDQFSPVVHATNGLNANMMREIYRELCQNVICVSSDLSGQGKTEWIKEASFAKKKIPYSLLISDGMEFRRLVRQFKECRLRPVESLHINIVSSDHPGDVNTFLFELLTLGIVFTNVDIACLPPSETPTYIFIEIASTTKQHLINSLPMASCLLFNHLSWNIKNLRVSQEINSPMQVACNYLNLLDHNEIDAKVTLFRTDKAIKNPLPIERCQNLIAKYFFNNKNAADISSFRFVEIFVNVLADQLVRFSSSLLFTGDNLKLVEETNIRILVLRNLIDVSRDSATRSIKIKGAQLKSTSAIDADDEKACRGTIVQWDDSNHLIVFFNSQTHDIISVLYRDRNKVHENIKTLLKSQVIGDQTKWELDDYNSMPSEALLLKLECLARRTTEKLYLPEYALSGDNLIKMALILLRARANIPVIVCGEAGCGKTSLIAYLALIVEVQFMALNMHAGIDEKIIMFFMNDALKKAEKGEIWLFFDEINTCNHIGLLADLISRRMLNDKPIHPNIRLFSACNPYRIRTRTQSEVGLTNKIKMYEERSNLVYQVKPLPDQILDYVWDYGTLKPSDEYKCIQIMVERYLKELAHPVFAELLYTSQKFIRNVEEPYSVSLRDVKRALTLAKFFYNSLEIRPAYKKGHKYPPPGNPTITTRSYVLALGLCYHSRLYDQDLRKQYRCEMEQILRNHEIYIEENMFSKIIREEQEDYINRMQCPPNTAHNEDLLENVFAMIVCILTRIPLFLIGATGSSKSLAIRIISSNLRGSDSNDKFFRKLPQIYIIPYQGSSSSTSDGLIKVFDKANKYQETTSKQFPVISVVLLDNVDLAEANPFNPLKILHSLLEPSYPATGPTVSVIGISNWRLDSSKSSRALLVQRPQFNLDDLVDTAERLLNEGAIAFGQRDALNPLTKAYSNFVKYGQSSSNFHGLRDYYALVKRLSLNEITPENIQMALSRSFGGIGNHAKLCDQYFGNVLKMFNNHKPWPYKQIPIEQLIDSNLNDSDARHLMVIGKSDSIVNLLTCQLRRRDLDPVVILGSQFPDDQEDYYYSVLRRIMMYVEAGSPLILIDLETIYGSLYDLWNQNYIAVGSKDNVKYFTRVALGAYANPMFYVSPNFKCILVIYETKLAFADPPLLHRFEKQRLSINDLLDDKQKLLVEYLDNWTNQITTLVKANSVTGLHNRFTQEDLFIGFDKDETLQSLIFHITTNNPEANDNDILEKCKESLIAIASADGIIRAELSILEKDEVDRWKHVYFNQQHHNGLSNCFDALFGLFDPEGQLVIINTFSKIYTDFKSCLQDYLRYQVHNLSIIKTEVQISKIVKDFFFESMDQVLILQCDINTINAKCIKLVKYIVEQFRNEFLAEKEKGESNMPIKHACIIFHIRRDYESNLIKFSFICGWKQITIESLKSPEAPLTDFLDKPLNEIINSEFYEKIVDSTMPFEKILEDELLWCLSCIKYQHSNVNYIRFVKILSFKLEYHLTKKTAQIMTFHEFIKKESADDNEYVNLKSLFEEFAISWNSIISHIDQYQSEELLNKPHMNLELPVIFGLVEQKNNGIYLCAILDFLIKLHNEFLDDIINIPIEECKSLNFIKNLTWNYLNSKTYFIISTVAQALDDNFINYEWNDKILKYNQRNMGIKGNVNFIFDLQKIEMKLARKLVLDKVYFKMENNQFYLKNFSFKYELFHNSPKILFDIKKVLLQVPIPGDKILMILTFFQQSNSSLILNSSTNSVNLSELLFLFEIMLCFIKELSIKNNNILILDFVDQWLKLAKYNIASIDILKEFSLKHIIAFYELIEEQVANSTIHNIDDKFKIPLMQQMKDSINKVVSYNSQNQQLIPAKKKMKGEENNESFASASSLTARKNLIKKFKKFTS
ncbi:hypothetical protein RhiirA5_472770 [Rhizophagus irregularis]|uniref:AAA+ ATPase domain-containing protein n=1 Tax=Rhizophagus irregularis TaxID=588596 RepID=A0A2N0NN67_9GLOM|nr:hypothetical protein RhiirA5_472770 [Rhizophagus irregularis]